MKSNRGPKTGRYPSDDPTEAARGSRRSGSGPPKTVAEPDLISFGCEDFYQDLVAFAEYVANFPNSIIGDFTDVKAGSGGPPELVILQSLPPVSSRTTRSRSSSSLSSANSTLMIFLLFRLK